MAAFGKFIDAANTAINRASQVKLLSLFDLQFTNEIRGASTKSAYPDDIIHDFETADRLKKVCEKLHSGVNAWLNPNPGTV